MVTFIIILIRNFNISYRLQAKHAIISATALGFAFLVIFLFLLSDDF